MAYLVFTFVSFSASIIGSVCGIGGGVIIKPVLDAFGLYSISTISFMSGCMVLSMSAYSVLKAQLAHESVIDKEIGTCLGIGAALGGLLGKQLFDFIANLFEQADTIGAVQSAALLIATLGTALYTGCKSRIHVRQVKTPVFSVGIGLCLGTLSAFLGIGGGPINLVVLYLFFSMETKTAAQNSLYIILFSQTASLLFSILTGNIPEFPWALFVSMICCSILGGAVGRKINKRIDNQAVSKLFIGVLVAIMGICCYNLFRYC